MAIISKIVPVSRVQSDGMTQTPGAGDCADMETRMPTSLNAKGKERCRILLIKPAPSSRDTIKPR